MAAKNVDDSDNMPNREELLQMAIEAARAGQKDGARVIFRQILEQDKRNQRAMMWMAKLADSKEERIRWLEMVVSTNPDNITARKELNRIRYTRAARENRTLVIFGVIAVVLILVFIIAMVLLFMNRGV
ncbi:MAG: hypothetical protein KC547_01995 [Anaerolineae bacterium]|nr:hypothetical protein [Anaerolineae bacterium]MCA9909707.1 hypothetical protein [Anaerolineae bacterium]